jgi:hypothetical protein
MSANGKTIKLQELMEKATPLPLKLNRYDHGGGRLFQEEPRKLVADFYEEADRELFVAMRNHLPEILARMDALEEVAKAARVVSTHSNGPYNMTTDINQSLREEKDLRDALARLDGVR